MENYKISKFLYRFLKENNLYNKKNITLSSNLKHCLSKNAKKYIQEHYSFNNYYLILHIPIYWFNNDFELLKLFNKYIKSIFY